MARAVDLFSLILLGASMVAFVFGLVALSAREDFKAVYLLLTGGLALRAATELLRPRGAS